MAGVLANSVSQTMEAADSATVKVVAGYLSGEQIALSLTPTPSSVVWSQSIPSGSVPLHSALSSATSLSPRFTPDVGGDYVLTAVVDGSTVYKITIGVDQAAVTRSLEAIRYTPKAAATVTAPVQGQATFFDDDEGRIRAKNPDGTLTDIGPRTGTVTLSAGSATIVDESIGANTHVALTLITASDLGTISVEVEAGAATITSTDASDASTFSYALIG